MAGRRSMRSPAGLPPQRVETERGEDRAIAQRQSFRHDGRMVGHATDQSGVHAADRVLPVLRQLPLSHYNEKVRWALDYKRIPHLRRSLLPGAHAVEAQRLTGTVSTTPVLTIDGESIGDSTRIIATIERRWPNLIYCVQSQ